MMHATSVPTPLVLLKKKVGTRAVHAPVDVSHVTPALTDMVHVHTPGTDATSPLSF